MQRGGRARVTPPSRVVTANPLVRRGCAPRRRLAARARGRI